MPGKTDFNSLKAGCVALSPISFAISVAVGRDVEAGARVGCKVRVDVDLICTVGVIIGVAVVQASRTVRMVKTRGTFLSMVSAFSALV